MPVTVKIKDVLRRWQYCLLRRDSWQDRGLALLVCPVGRSRWGIRGGSVSSYGADMWGVFMRRRLPHLNLISPTILELETRGIYQMRWPGSSSTKRGSRNEMHLNHEIPSHVMFSEHHCDGFTIHRYRCYPCIRGHERCYRGLEAVGSVDVKRNDTYRILGSSAAHFHNLYVPEIPSRPKRSDHA